MTPHRMPHSRILELSIVIESARAGKQAADLEPCERHLRPRSVSCSQPQALSTLSFEQKLPSATKLQSVSP